MKILKILSILLLLSPLNFVFGDTEISTEKTIYKKYLHEGSLITLVRFKGASTSSNAYSFTLYITEESNKNEIWVKNIAHYSVDKNFDADKALVLHATDRTDDNLYLVYTFEKNIYFETIKKNSNIWKVDTSADIPTDLSKMGVRDVSIFTTDTGSYVFLEDFNNLKEYWLASDNPPKLLWTSKNEKSGNSMTYQQWLEHIKSSPDSDPLKAIEKMQKELKEQDNSENPDGNQVNADDDNNSDENADDASNAENSVNSDANNNNSQNHGANDKNKITNHNADDNADNDSTDVPSTTLRDQIAERSRSSGDTGNKYSTSSDSDIFVILGISASIIALLLLISLVILPKFRK